MIQNPENSQSSLPEGAKFEQELGPLVKAIDDAVATIHDEGERQRVRQVVGEAVQSAVHQLAARQALAASEPPMGTLSGGAMDKGLKALDSVKDLGFVEFTTGLINGTFDAIIAATIKQVEAYARLVADLAKTLAEFQRENVSTEDVNGHLAARYPDGAGGTQVRADFKFQKTDQNLSTGAATITALEKAQAVGDRLKAEVRGIDATFDARDVEIVVEDAEGEPASFTGSWVQNAREVMSKRMAKSMIEHLRAMAREGMARIIIPEGELLSKLTFSVVANEHDSVLRKQYESSGKFRTKMNWSGTGFGWKGQYNLNCTSINESSYDDVSMNAEIIGMVRLKFRTETFAPVIVEGPIG